MGCINSKPVPSETNEKYDRNNSESIEIIDKESSSSRSSTSKKSELRKDSVSKEDNQSFRIETETTNVLYTSNQNELKSTNPTPPPSPPAPPVASPTASAKVPTSIPQTDSPKVQKQKDINESSGEKKLKLSELLHAEKMKKTSGSISSSGEGKEGWLYREKEFFHPNEDPYLKIWAVIAHNRLTYYLNKPKGGDYLHDFSAKGYFDLESGSDCRVVDKKSNDNGGILGGSIGRYLFRLKEHNNTAIIFSTTSEVERNEWVYVIQEALRGVSHTPVTPSIPTTPNSSTPVPDLKRASSKRLSGLEIVEFPKMVGSLKKKSIEGKRFGFKNIKTRWFRLESGELRYYSEESMRPSKLKGTMSLKDCSMPTGEDNSGENISILRPDGNTLLMMAFSPESARDWRTAIGESIILLNRTSSGKQGSKKRRENLSNCVTHDDSNSAHINSEIVPKSEEATQTLVTAMKQHFLLNTLLDYTPVLNALRQEISYPGDVLIWQESIGDLFFILESGFVDIIKNDTKVAKLGPGKAFGELALINDINRTATVKAVSLCSVWTLDRQTFRKVLATQETTSRSNKIAFLKSVQLFVKLDDATLGQIADVMKLIEYEPNERIIKQGEIGDQFYIIQNGTVSVTQGNKELTRLTAGSYFGELALISNEPRKATVTSITSLYCYTIDKATFTSVLGSLKDAETQSTGITILRKVKLLETLPEKHLLTISKCLETVEYNDGENIVVQGDEGDQFYMIASGAVSVFVNHAEVARLNTGSYFGEMALLNDERRNATVTALGPVVCLTLNRAQFVKLLGPLDELLKEEARRREEAAKQTGLFGRLQKGFFQKRSSSSSSSSQKKLSDDSQNGMRFSLDELTTVRILGTGRFGIVKLVQHNTSHKSYALKILHKAILEECSNQHVPEDEKQLLQSLEHPFIPALYGTFQDLNSLYFLLELIPGGDMWSVLYDDTHHTTFQTSTKYGGIEINMAKFYFSNVLSAISYLHANDIIYRDLKPENLVMGREGYLKIVDFGSAKKLIPPAVTNTICGTPEYVAPEMIAARGHNRAVDYWSLGVFLFELLHRATPFEQNDTAGVYQKIIHADETLKESFKPQFDQSAKSLILQLLSITPGLRIGMLRNGVEDIWRHPFLSELTPEDILTKAIPAPLRPDMDRLMDSTSFDTDTPLDIPTYHGRYDYSSFSS